MFNIATAKLFNLPVIFWMGGFWFLFGSFIDSTANIVIGGVMINFGVMEIMFEKWHQGEKKNGFKK